MIQKQTAVEYLFEKINDILIEWSEGKISSQQYGIKAALLKSDALKIELANKIEYLEQFVYWHQTQKFVRFNEDDINEFLIQKKQ